MLSVDDLSEKSGKEGDELSPLEIQAAGRRDPGVRVMPAHGLCLEEIVYPDTQEGQRRRGLESRARRETPCSGPRG